MDDKIIAHVYEKNVIYPGDEMSDIQIILAEFLRYFLSKKYKLEINEERDIIPKRDKNGFLYETEEGKEIKTFKFTEA